MAETISDATRRKIMNITDFSSRTALTQSRLTEAEARHIYRDRSSEFDFACRQAVRAVIEKFAGRNPMEEGKPVAA